MVCKGGFALDNTCSYREGSLPACAPLAVATIPMQASAEPTFDQAEALRRGTLFPGLDLPFMDYVATGELEDTPRAELMALDFVAHELALYLDTHPDDAEAFEMWKVVADLAAEGRERYVKMCGPVMKSDVAQFDSWVWPDAPWPWEYCGKGGKG